MPRQIVPPEKRDWFYVSEVALANGCDERTVRRWIERRRLEAIRSTQSWQISATALKEIGKRVPDIGTKPEADFWRFEIEAFVAEKVQSKYAAELSQLWTRSDELNAEINEMHDAARSASLPNERYPAIAMATMILGVRCFHAARGIACLAANGHGAEARPLSRQAQELVSVLIELRKDSSGQRAREWLLGNYHVKPSGVVKKSFGEVGEENYGYLADDAHGRPAYIGLELLRRLSDREHVWIPLADAEEDRILLDVTSAVLKSFTTSATLTKLEIQQGQFGDLVDINRLSKAWSKN